MSDKLPYGQVYRTVEQVKQEIEDRGHSMPEDWNNDTVVSGIGIYNRKTGVLSRWLISTQDEEAGR